MSDPTVLWSFVFLLTGVVGQELQLVQYPLSSMCAVRGSTITLPCTFTPRKSFMREDGQIIPLKVVRVLWCINHLICHSTTPSVFDSNSTTNDPRYQYLGDLEGNCSLQIRDVMVRDGAIFRFRMEADNSEGHFTGQTGVTVSVVDRTSMRIKSSSNNTEFRRGQTVSLLCSTLCSINQLEITWMKDGHALSETGPALQLSSLTVEDSGNYTCALRTNSGTRSEPFRLQVEEEEEGDSGLPLILGVVFGVLLAVITLILVVIIIRRKRAAVSHDAVGGKAELKPDAIYSSVLPPAEDAAGHQGARKGEECSYASVQFRHNKPIRNEEAAADDIVYSSVASRA